MKLFDGMNHTTHNRHTSVGHTHSCLQIQIFGSDAYLYIEIRSMPGSTAASVSTTPTHLPVPPLHAIRLLPEHYDTLSNNSTQPPAISVLILEIKLHYLI